MNYYNDTVHVSMTDEEVCDLIRRGGMERVVENNIPLILKYLRRKYGADSEDVMHDILPYVMECITKYDSSLGSFSGWVKGAVRNGITDRERGIKKANRLINEPSARSLYLDDITNKQLSPFDTIVKGESTRHKRTIIARALIKLNRRARRLIWLRYWKDLKFREIARLVGLGHPYIVQVKIEGIINRMGCLINKQVPNTYMIGDMINECNIGTAIENIGLKVRTMKYLRRLGIYRLRDLCNLSFDDLQGNHYFGDGMINDIQSCINMVNNSTA